MSDEDSRDPRQEESKSLREIPEGLKADLAVIRRQLGCLIVLVTIIAVLVIFILGELVN